jgi:hypothetical protein
LNQHRINEKPGLKELAATGLHYLLAASVIVTTAGYFLLENGSGNSFSTYLITLTLLPLSLLRKQTTFINLPLLSLIAACLTYLAASVLWSHSGESVLQHLGYALLIISFCASIPISIAYFPSFLSRLVSLTVMAAFVSSVYSIYLHFALPEYQPLPEQRMYAMGRLKNPVIGALSYGFAMTLAIYMLFTECSRSVKGAYLGAMLIFTTAIILSGSRGVYFALTASTSMAILLRYPSNRKLQILGVIMTVLMFFAVAAIFLGPELLFKRALSFRPEIWSEFISRTVDSNTYIGLGMSANSGFLIPELFIQHPHSVFIATFYYGGIVGLSMYLCLVLTSIFALNKPNSTNVQLLAAMLLAYGMTATAFDGNEILTKVNYLWLLIWFPVGLALTKINTY